MSKKIWLALPVVVVVAVAVSLVARTQSMEWTSSSPEAIAEFQAAMDASMKLYHDDVRAHLEKAVELDPDFVIAKLYLLERVKRDDDEEQAKKLYDEVYAADISRLTERERLIIERNRAFNDKRYEDASRMIDDYLERYPNDPYILHQKALAKWYGGELDEAERLNRRLIEIAPNWVIAYNQLGYIAMSRGRFVEAEEYFSSYRFVAPDQANPHDSLGELYIITGRYEEAETSLLRSLEIRPDFWNAYDHLALARLMMEDLAGAEQALLMMQSSDDSPDYWSVGMDCLLNYARLSVGDQWEEILELYETRSECREGHSQGNAVVVAHRAACSLGRMDVAQAIEDEVAELIAKIEKGDVKGEKPEVLGLQAHLRGVRHATLGDYDGAVESFKLADEFFHYMMAGSGLFKLRNKLDLVETLLAAGEDAKAHQLLSKIRSVNARMVDEFEENGLKTLGLERE
jgi:tetratricopeptide (TPR) repeat protein